MKLIFSGNDYKYELEAAAKIFFPAQKFEFAFDSFDLPEKDFLFFRKKQFKNYCLLYVYADVNGVRCRKAARDFCMPADKQCEEQLARLMYLALNKLTGKTSEWGILTGVRPVKRVNALIKEGKNEEEISRILKEKYYVSDEKIAVAFDTAYTQEKCLEKHKTLKKDNGFELYISIPFCPSRCSYCSFISQSAAGNAIKKLIPSYVEQLCEEIKYTAMIVSKIGLVPETIYFGGGTPTTLSAAQLERIMKTIAQSFDISDLSEYTIEAGRPDTVTEEKLCCIKENGCTRVSINPQTLSDEVLKRIGREHTAEEFFSAFEAARKVKFDTINTDLIAGLPGDTPQSFENTMNGIIALRPENITVHTLSIKRSSRINATEEKDGALVQPARQMVKCAADKLYSSGYMPYYLYRQKNMVDNLENIGWSLKDRESLYNICIMEEIKTIIALGAAASTKLVDLKNGRLERIFNYKYPADYIANFQLMLNRKKELEDFYAEKK